MDGDVKKIRQIVAVPKIIVQEGVDGAELIPVDLGGRLVQPPVSINDLGKQLLKAAIKGNIDDIKLLMNRGAPFTADWLGTSPLHFAAQHNHLEVCEILLRAGISKDARTKVDRTPLHIAVYEGHIEIVECLLRHKADIDCKDLLAMTPLHWAAQNGHIEIASLLVRQGAHTNIVNKFDLTPVDIAIQCNRHDIVEIINTTVQDPEVATQNLTIEMNEMDNSNDDVVFPTIETITVNQASPLPVPIETVLLEDFDSENSIEPERLHITEDSVSEDLKDDAEEQTIIREPDTSNQLSESMKLLQEHGITMLPADDSNILTSILETGHSVVLTEVGKQVLNSTKPIENPANVSKPATKVKTLQTSMKPKKIITVTPQEFMAMTLNQGDVLKQINGKLLNTAKPTVKRIAIKKNKIVPVIPNTPVPKIQKQINTTDVQTLMQQLMDAKNLVEEYKQKLLKKEAEAERYKQELRLIAQSKNTYC